MKKNNTTINEKQKITSPQIRGGGGITFLLIEIKDGEIYI